MTLCFAVGAFGIPAARAENPKTEFTLSEFCALAQQSGMPETQRAEEVFFRLIAAQGSEAAARQSLDRLSGWHPELQSKVSPPDFSATSH